jgi:hypothetical protein
MKTLVWALAAAIGSISAQAAEPVKLECTTQDMSFYRITGTLNADGRLTSVKVVDTTAGEHLVSLPETLKGVTPKTVQVSPRWVASLDAGWGIMNRPNFIGKAVTWNFGMIEKSRGDSLMLLIPNKPISLEKPFVGSLFSYGNDQSAGFERADCRWFR